MWGRCGPRSGYSTSPIACIANPTSAGYDAIGRRSPRLRTGGGGKGSTVTPTATATRTIGGGTSLTAVARTSTYDVGASIEFKTGHNPNTSSGAFRVKTADGGNRGNSGEISLRTGKANQGNSRSVLFETGPASSCEGGE
jgi:hypothetical protein